MIPIESATEQRTEEAISRSLAGSIAVRRFRLGRSGQLIAVRVGLVVFVILLWWVLASFAGISSVILASPGAVIDAARTSGHEVIPQIGSTATEVGIALGIAWGAGLVLGVTLGSIRPLWPLLGLARSAYAIPIVIIYPIMTVWFGYGAMSKVIFGAFAGLIPMLLMSASAVATVDPRVTLLFHSLGSSRIATMRKGIVPAILPGIVGALRLSGSLCFVSVIVGEMLVSTRGLGYFIAQSADTYDTPSVYLGICCVIILAILLHALIGLVQKSSLRYGMRNSF